jgi:hypothetical protein
MPMKLVSTSTAALAALGVVVGGSAGALACDWHMQQVTAQATPVPDAEEVAETPVIALDPVLLAELDKKAILPKEEEAETAAAE